MSETLPAITQDQLAKQDGVQSDRVWVAYKGLVYDVTDSDLFKNGKHYRHKTDHDLDGEMDKAPHTEAVLDNFQVVGRLA